MRRLLIATLCFFLLVGIGSPGCKKTIENVKEDFVINLITNNIWLVTNFTEGSDNLTSSFVPYEFKFNKDETVHGIKTGAPDALGTWKGDANSMTITSSFPNGPVPLNKLTGVWHITKTTLSSVKATRTEGGMVYYLDLVKK